MGLENKWCPLMGVSLHYGECKLKSGPCSSMSLMLSWHWPPLTETSLSMSPSDGLALFLETIRANCVKVVKKIITIKFRFHSKAIYALGCFCTPVPKIPLRAHSPNPMRPVEEWILMLLIKTINLKTVILALPNFDNVTIYWLMSSFP